MPPSPAVLLGVFAGTLFTSATLLFLVQPMVGKLILPLLGGTPAVWNTCMVFFQALLLAGYAYAHATTAWFGARRQALLHLGLLAIPLIFFPLNVNRDLIALGDDNPIPSLLLVLFLSVGVPFFVVSTSAPLLQKWFAETGHPDAADPYFLYGASNLGSMLALLGYPTLVEPYLRLTDQRYGWCFAYGLLAVLTALCAFLLRSTTPHKSASAAPTASLSEPVTARRRLRWIALAAVPSSLMLGVTTYMTTDIAAIPLLWVLPLTLYLLSFIIVFARIPSWLQALIVTLAGVVLLIGVGRFTYNPDQKEPLWPALIWLILLTAGVLGAIKLYMTRRSDMLHRYTILAMPLTVLLLLFMITSGISPTWIGYAIAQHLGVLFIVALACHGELAQDRPSPSHLTEYFLWMSVGGVLGGLFNALIAPLVFNSLVEYQLAMVAACFLLPDWGPKESRGGSFADGGLALLFVALGAVLIGLSISGGKESFTLDNVWNGPWRAFAAGVVGVVAAGLFHVLLSSKKTASVYLDALLPPALGILTAGLYLGLDSEFLRGRVTGAAIKFGLSPEKLYKILKFGVPAVLCYTFVERPFRFGLSVGSMLLAIAFCAAVADQGTLVLYQERSFFGVLYVEQSDDAIGATQGSYPQYQLLNNRLRHGTTIHGEQFKIPTRDPSVVAVGLTGLLSAPESGPLTATGLALTPLTFEQLNTEPLTYYHRTGPIGDIFRAYNHDPAIPFGVIGLGTGTMSCYALPGQQLTFYDIDPVVRRITYDSSKYFSYLEQAERRGAKRPRLVMGDARLTMSREKPTEDEKYGLLVVDAFSSDAIPVHLITWQALQMFFEHIREDGIICFHVSNRWLDLEWVLAAFVDYGGYSALIFDDLDTHEPGKLSSQWVAFARKPADLDRLVGGSFGANRWRDLKRNPVVGVWNDDYSNLFRVFKPKD